MVDFQLLAARTPVSTPALTPWQHLPWRWKYVFPHAVVALLCNPSRYRASQSEMARWPRLRLTEPSEAIIGASATDAAGKIDGDTASSVGGGGLQLITSTRGSFVSRKHPAHILST